MKNQLKLCSHMYLLYVYAATIFQSILKKSNLTLYIIVILKYIQEPRVIVAQRYGRNLRINIEQFIAINIKNVISNRFVIIGKILHSSCSL